MRTERLLTLNLVLYLLAALVAGYLVYNHYMALNGEGGFHSFCSINSTMDCDLVNSSQYSELLGIPTATFGLVYYLFGALLTMIALRSVYLRREALLVLIPASTLSILISILMFSFSVQLKAFCLMCVTLYALGLATWILTLLAWKKNQFKGSYREEWKNADRKRVGKLLATGLGLFIVTHGLASQLHEPFPFEKEAFLAEFRAQAPMGIDLGRSPRLGSKVENPALTIVEFADFQCPGCGVASKQMHLLLRKYGDKIQLVFKNFPLDPTCNSFINQRMHEQACFAAKSALCAHLQGEGKFEKMFEKLFENQRDIRPDTVKKWLQESGVDMAQHEQCMSSREASALLQKDIALGNTLGMHSTPTFFVNGRKVEGIIDEQRLRAIMQELGVR